MHILSYVPHGINPDIFFPISQESNDWVEYNKFVADFKSKHSVEHVIFFNSRNIRRKQPSDVILGFKMFCDGLSQEEASKYCLFMKTHIQDPNGTDLLEVKRKICPDYKVIFNQEHISQRVLNFFYNLADVTVSMSSAEGFGLSTAESIMSGTMVIAPVHGGLQDQMNFTHNDKDVIPSLHKLPTNELKYGSWIIPMFPDARQLQGSLQTPYIFDYVVDASQLSLSLFNLFYNISDSERNQNGLNGREWMISGNLNSNNMSTKFIESMNVLFETWKPKQKYEFIKFEE